METLRVTFCPACGRRLDLIAAGKAEPAKCAACADRAAAERGPQPDADPVSFPANPAEASHAVG